jgi:transcriptional regulator with XRE-family HTH domain
VVYPAYPRKRDEERVIDTMKKKLKDVIKDTRKKLGLSLRAVEKLAEGKVSNAYISRIENGHEKNISPEALRMLGIALRLNYVNLLILGGHITLKEAMEFNLHNHLKERRRS